MVTRTPRKYMHEQVSVNFSDEVIILEDKEEPYMQAETLVI